MSGEVSNAAVANASKVETQEECYCCGGGPLILHTEADQSDVLQGSGEFMCYDGDPLICRECGFRHHMSVDEDGADLTWDEDTPENLATWEKTNG